MTTIRQLIQTGPAKANELLAKLVDTSDTAVKTRERLFSDLKAELELLATLEEEHLFPILRKHKETKSLVSEALNDNKQTRKLIAELEQTPKESEEFAPKVAELRKVFQQSVRDEKNELLPAVLKALSDEEAQEIVERIEAEKAQIEEARRAEAEQRRAEARFEREQEEKALAEQEDAAERAQRSRTAVRQTADAVVRTGEVAAESANADRPECRRGRSARRDGADEFRLHLLGRHVRHVDSAAGPCPWVGPPTANCPRRRRKSSRLRKKP